MDIIGLLVFFIVLGLACWTVGTLSEAFKIPAPIVSVVYVILVIIVVLSLLQFVGGTRGPVLRW